MQLPKLKINFWQAEGPFAALAATAQAWYQQVLVWLSWPQQQMDPLHCSEGILNLLAWQRDIERFTGEPLALYRKRVAFAFVNAKDAGSINGFKRIMQRLEIGAVEIDQRITGRDWDIISIRLSDGQIASNSKLLQQIIRQYGRTCRRYEWRVITPVAVSISAGSYGYEQMTDVVRFDGVIDPQSAPIVLTLKDPLIDAGNGDFEIVLGE